MAQLMWDQVGERSYQNGISHGVLYLQDGTVAVWNGLTGMEEGSDADLTSYYLEGVKYFENLTPGDFSGKLEAITYPDEFNTVLGIIEVNPGFQYYEQPPQSFCLSYQTRLATDQEPEQGYKIHLLYNLLAVPDSIGFETLGKEAQPIEFAWSLTGTPTTAPGYRPTVHVSLDSTKVDAETLAFIEDILYGTSDTEPRFPSISEIRQLFESVGALIIIDNGDGTWTALDTSNEYITMDSSTEFTITGADATMLDATTYEISTTTP